MLMFYPCSRWDLPTAENTGVLFQNLHDAQLLMMNQIIVLDHKMLNDLRPVGTGFHAGSIPSDAVLNFNPYATPREVIASGGIVHHRVTGHLLCIKRHGVIDLPKGKLDPGETIASCAKRELQEETGITDLTQGRLLGTTIHGYRRSNYFDVKTTFWYSFTSEANQFTPALSEGIESVFWLPYADAEQTLGYAPLSDFLKDLRSVIKESPKNSQIESLQSF